MARHARSGTTTAAGRSAADRVGRARPNQGASARRRIRGGVRFLLASRPRGGWALAGARRRAIDRIDDRSGRARSDSPLPRPRTSPRTGPGIKPCSLAPTGRSRRPRPGSISPRSCSSASKNGGDARPDRPSRRPRHVPAGPGDGNDEPPSLARALLGFEGNGQRHESARASGGRVIAVGTTMVRALETTAGRAGSGWAALTILPGHRLRGGRADYQFSSAPVEPASAGRGLCRPRGDSPRLRGSAGGGISFLQLRRRHADPLSPRLEEAGIAPGPLLTKKGLPNGGYFRTTIFLFDVYSPALS